MIKTANGQLVEGGSQRARRIIRRGGLKAVTGYSLPYIYELIAAGEFPAPIPLGKRAVGWIEDEIIEWQAERIKARDAKTMEDA